MANGVYVPNRTIEVLINRGAKYCRWDGIKSAVFGQYRAISKTWRKSVGHCYYGMLVRNSYVFYRMLLYEET